MAELTGIEVMDAQDNVELCTALLVLQRLHKSGSLTAQDYDAVQRAVGLVALKLHVRQEST